MNKIILLCGKSGVGKTTVAQELEERYGLTQVHSYTTRPPRYENEQGHIFVDNTTFSELDLVAYTFFNNNHYGATVQQVEDNEIYVIDKDGVINFKNIYRGNKSVVVVLLTAPLDRLITNMTSRGDSIEKINERLQNDGSAFKDIKKLADYVIENDSIDKTVEKIYKIYKGE